MSDVPAAAVTTKPKRKHKGAITGGTHVLWPRRVELRYGVSAVTRWRWERECLLPPRDVFIGGRSGWKPETLATAEQRKAAP